MNSPINTFLDFDGTLVHQNSSQVLIKHLLSRPSTPLQRLVAAAFNSPLQWLLTKTLGAFTRLANEKDMTLWLLMHLFHGAFDPSDRRLYQAVAADLTLNTALAGEYSQPFIILSVGLQPVIEEFLKQHPEVNCAGVYGSNVRLRGRRYQPALKDIHHKLEHLEAADRPRYFTDFEHEAKVFRAALATGYRVTALPLKTRKPIYLLEAAS